MAGKYKDAEFVMASRYSAIESEKIMLTNLSPEKKRRWQKIESADTA